jgi:hypothetical protein
MRPLRILAVLLVSAFALAACEKVQENVALAPAAQSVEFAMDTPSENLYTLAGTVNGVAAGKNIQEAELSARNDAKNQAAAMGATLVVIDEDTGAVLLYQDKPKVTIRGRAFKPIQ